MRGFCRSGIRGSGKISLWYAMRVNRDKEKLLVTCVCSNIEREAAVRTETIGWIIGILIAAALVWWIYRKIKRKMRQLASTPEVQVLRYVAKHLSEGDLTQPGRIQTVFAGGNGPAVPAADCKRFPGV